jgi:hypothetical protein
MEHPVKSHPLTGSGKICWNFSKANFTVREVLRSGSHVKTAEVSESETSAVLFLGKILKYEKARSLKVPALFLYGELFSVS